jgi:1-acyl-sn-glycerol-3-phosphate acyltransferase
MTRLLRLLFWILVARPLVLIVLGLNVRHQARLPKTGPAILVANHNSHLDTFVLMSLFPLRMLNRLRPVAAADYFLRWKPLAWFTLNIVNMIPLERGKVARGADPLQACAAALARGEILLVFPEGTRGESEAMAKFEGGVARLKEQHPDVPVVPVFMQGLGRVLPKGEIALVPVVVDVFVGEPVTWNGSRPEFTLALQQAVLDLAASAYKRQWH